MARDDFDDWRMRLDQLDDYVARVARARLDHPSLTIRLGLEVDYLPGQEDWIRTLAKRHPWDYFIGSVHYITDSWAVDNPHQRSQWKGRDPFEVWTIYFDRLTQAARSGLFDIIGHADLPKKFGILPTPECTPLFQRFLEAAGEKDVAVELNTAGLRKDCRDIYPGVVFCGLMKDYGTPVTFGSDAHAIVEVGMDFDRAMERARRAGFTAWRRFHERRHELVPL
jgi:histidinol-phosphatase (PHP family)